MQRLITAAALLIFAFYLIFLSAGPLFVAAALLVGFLCYREFAALAKAHGFAASNWLGVAGGICLVMTPVSGSSSIFVLPGILLFLILSMIALLRLEDLRSILPSAACTFAGAFYAFGPWRFAIDLRNKSVHMLFFALALNWAGDSLAYYVGRKFGRRRLAPRLSPNKSWEGAIASIAGSALFGVLYLGYFLPQTPKWQVIGMAVIGNIAGQLGDLTESAIKRGAGVKDSGHLLPGHGGALDRLDSSMFALPVVYLLSCLSS